jgi:hypothetical protein
MISRNSARLALLHEHCGCISMTTVDRPGLLTTPLEPGHVSGVDPTAPAVVSNRYT